MNISGLGLSIVKHFEGLRLKAYKDPVGIWTIGYGHTGDAAFEGNVISEAQAEALLRDDMADSEEAVARMIEVTPAQQGIAFSVRGAPSAALPWVEGWTFRHDSSVLTFRRSANSGPATELRYDTGGDHFILKRQ